MALGVDSASNRNEYKEYLLGDKGGRCVGLTTLPPSCADCLEILESQPPGTLRACPGLYRRADKSLARPERKQATAREDFDIYPIYNHNWRNINTIYIYTHVCVCVCVCVFNKTSIKRNILTIKQNTSGSRLGKGLMSTPVMGLVYIPASYWT